MKKYLSFFRPAIPGRRLWRHCDSVCMGSHGDLDLSGFLPFRRLRFPYGFFRCGVLSLAAAGIPCILRNMDDGRRDFRFYRERRCRVRIMPAGQYLQHVVFQRTFHASVKSGFKVLPDSDCRSSPAAAIWPERACKPDAFHLVYTHINLRASHDRITLRSHLHTGVFYDLAYGTSDNIHFPDRFLRRRFDSFALFPREHTTDHGITALRRHAERAPAHFQRRHEFR